MLKKSLQNINGLSLDILGDNKKDRRIYSREKIFIPSFANANLYYKSTGAFSSAFLLLFREIIREFVKKGGKIKIISENKLDDKDFELIQSGYDMKKIVEKNLESEIEKLEQITKNIDEKFKPLKFISKLIQDGSLEMKVGYPKDHKNRGIHHSKLDIWKDDDSNILAISGSQNASYYAHFFSQEHSHVFYSWHDHEDVGNSAYRNEKLFIKWWNDLDEDFNYYEIPEAIKKGKLRVSEKDKESIDKWEEIIPITIKKYPELFPDIEEEEEEEEEIILRPPPQTCSIKKWDENGKEGILQVATGVGKTIIGIYAARQALKDGMNVLISVPGEYLSRQWNEELNKWISSKYKPILRIGGYKPNLQGSKGQYDLNNLLSSNKPNVILSTHSMVSREDWLKIYKKHQEKFLYIADEAHELGQRVNQKILGWKIEKEDIKNNEYGFYHEDLKLDFKNKMGLTATLERHFDSLGSKRIEKYFSKVVYDYTVSEAINDQWLTEYNYYPEICYLTEEEMIDYSSFQIIPSTDSDLFTNNSLKAIMRSEIAKNATNKVYLVSDIFDKYKHKLTPESHTLIFCNEIEQVDKLRDELIKININPYVYYGAMDNDKEKTIDDFSNAGGVLIGVDSLKQGVDIPKLQNLIILSSSGSKLEGVQRRGRVLRLDPTNNNKIANIFDVVTLPSPQYFSQELDASKFESLIKAELERMNLFGKDSFDSFTPELLRIKIEHKWKNGLIN